MREIAAFFSSEAEPKRRAAESEEKWFAGYFSSEEETGKRYVSRVDERR